MVALQGVSTLGDLIEAHAHVVTHAEDHGLIRVEVGVVTTCSNGQISVGGVVSTDDCLRSNLRAHTELNTQEVNGLAGLKRTQSVEVSTGVLGFRHQFRDTRRRHGAVDLGSRRNTVGLHDFKTFKDLGQVQAGRSRCGAEKVLGSHKDLLTTRLSGSVGFNQLSDGTYNGITSRRAGNNLAPGRTVCSDRNLRSRAISSVSHVHIFAEGLEVNISCVVRLGVKNRRSRIVGVKSRLTTESVDDDVILFAVEGGGHVHDVGSVRLDCTHECTLVTRIEQLSELPELGLQFTALVTGHFVGKVSGARVSTVLNSTATLGKSH